MSAQTILRIGLAVSTSVVFSACGGGGGPSPTNSSNTPIAFANLTVGSGVTYSNVTSVVVTPTQVVTTAFTATATAAGVADKKIQVQVWYLDVNSVRQTLVSTNLESFKKSYPSGITLSGIPRAVTTIQAESYFWNTTLVPAATTTSGVLSISL